VSRTENLAEKYQGRYRWTSDPDRDGDTVTATNCLSVEGVVIAAGAPGNQQAAHLTGHEARQLALAILDLLDGVCPHADPA